jgi:hypothetical protein
LNLTEGRVTQILKRALARLRNIMKESSLLAWESFGSGFEGISRLVEAYVSLCYHLRDFDHARLPEGIPRGV